MKTHTHISWLPLLIEDSLSVCERKSLTLCGSKSPLTVKLSTTHEAALCSTQARSNVTRENQIIAVTSLAGSHRAASPYLRCGAKLQEGLQCRDVSVSELRKHAAGVSSRKLRTRGHHHHHHHQKTATKHQV